VVDEEALGVGAGAVLASAGMLGLAGMPESAVLGAGAMVAGMVAGGVLGGGVYAGSVAVGDVRGTVAAAGDPDDGAYDDAYDGDEAGGEAGVSVCADPRCAD
jgi:hypothetical protein